MKKFLVGLFSLIMTCGVAIGISACNTAGVDTGSSSVQEESSSSEKHTHGWDEGELTLQPTCEEDGVMTYSCDCGETYTEGVNALGHSWDYGRVTTEPTCEVNGVRTYTCDCGDTYTEEIEAGGHNYFKKVTAPTCTTQGYTTYACLYCDDQYVKDYVGELGHDYVDHDAKEPTCTEIGWAAYQTCNREGCGFSNYAGDISARGHKYSYHDAKAATCTEIGWDAYKTCERKRCGYTTYSPIDALGHSYTNYVSNGDATCTEDGTKTASCDNACGLTDTLTDTGSVLGHNYVATVTAPTCTAQGYTTHVCSRGDHTYVDAYVDALGHSYTNYVSNEDATCTEDGTKTASCDNACGLTDTLTDTGSVLGHDYETTVTAPTCTAQGYTTYVCTRGDHTYVDAYVDALGHSYTNYVSNEDATCTEDGTKTASCDNACGLTDTLTDTGSALNHDYVATVTAPTCTAQGYTTYVCTRGDHTYVDDYVDALGHSYTNYVSNEDATCTEDGTKTASCDNGCGLTETLTDEGSALDHAYIFHDSKAPTCTEVGCEMYQTCGRVDCDYNTYEELPALGHQWVDEVCKRCSSEYYSEGLSYELSKDGTYYIVIGIGECTDNDLVIPQTHLSLPVKEIKANAFENSKQVKGVFLSSNITTIGAYSFYGCSYLRRLTIGAGVTSIGNYAFYANKQLKEVYYAATECADLAYENRVFYNAGHAWEEGFSLTIANNVKRIPAYLFSPYNPYNTSAYNVIAKLRTLEFEENAVCESIGTNAFAYCEYLKAIHIPDSVLRIEDGAFYTCWQTEVITIGKNVTSIGEHAFSMCVYLKEIYYNATNCADATNHTPFESSGTYVTAYIGANVERIPAHMLSPDGADDNRYGTGGVSNIVFEEGSVCKSIGQYAFARCYDLKEVVLNLEGLYIDDYAFYQCINLDKVTLGKGITHLGKKVFYESYAMTELVYDIPEVSDGTSSDPIFSYVGSRDGLALTIGKHVKSIPAYFFYAYNVNKDLPKVVSVTFEEGSICESIGEYAFYNCNLMKSVEIGANVTSIGKYAFYECTSLQGVYYHGDVAGWCGITYGDIYSVPMYYTNKLYIDGKVVTEIVIPDTVTEIKPYSFYNCDSLTSVEIGDGVTSIGNAAFYSCDALMKAVVGSSVKTVSSNVFGVCYKLIEFYNKSSYTITAGRGIALYAKNVYKPTSGVCKLSIDEDGFVIYQDGTNKILVGYKGTDTDLVVPDGITEIYKSAFYNCSAIKSVVIPNSVKTMGADIFYGCGALESLTLPFIGDSATVTSASLKTLLGYLFGTESYEGGVLTTQQYTSSSAAQVNYYIPETLRSITITGTNILPYTFYNCSTLTEVTIGNSVTDIGNYAFQNCSNLTKVNMGTSVKTIGYGVFKDCTSLQDIMLGDSITEIKSSAFSNCVSLTSIVLPKNLLTLNSNIFYGCTGLTEIKYNATDCTSSSSNIFNYAGQNGEGIKVIIGANVKNVPAYLFYSDEEEWTPKLISLAFEEGSVCESIGNYAFENNSTLTGTLTLPNTITSIGARAFLNCSGFTGTLTLPNTITSIGVSAFLNCSGFTGTLTLPNALTAVANYTFSGCSGFTGELVLPSGLKTIGANAFYKCSGLSGLIIPDSVTSIGDDAFYGCGLRSATIPTIAISTMTTSKLQTVIITRGDSIPQDAFKYCYDLTNIVIPDTVTSIGHSAFNGCSGLKSIVIPDSVTSIGNSAFSACNGLTSVVIPDSVTSLGSSAFSSCNSLTSVVIGDSLARIDDRTFSSCKSLTSVVIPNSVTSISSYAFQYCTSLTNIQIPNSVTSIGDYAFYDCDCLWDIELPNTLTNIGQYTFAACSNLTSIVIPKSVKSMGYNAFQGCAKLVIYCEVSSQPSAWNTSWNSSNRPIVWNCKNNELASDGYIYAVVDGVQYALKDGTAIVIPQSVDITKANIPAPLTYKNVNYTVTSVEDYAFKNCTNLLSVSLPNTVTNIGQSAFESCSNLTSINIPNSVTEIGKYAFAYCYSLTSIKIPNSVTTIGEMAFRDCVGLTIYCEVKKQPSGWNSSWNYAKCPVVWDCNNNDVATSGYIYTVVNGIRYALKDGTAMVVKQAQNLVEANIPDVVTYKGVDYNVTSISGDAFRTCIQLTSIIVDENNSAYSSLDGILYNKDKTELIQYPIGKKATQFTIPDTVTVIGAYAFYNCDNLASVVIGDSVTSIGEYAFFDCHGLTSVVIGDSVTSIGSYAFKQCYKMSNLQFGNSVTSIGGQAFYYCSSLTSVVIPDSVTSIGANAFYKCEELTNVTIPDSVTSIVGSAFYECGKLVCNEKGGLQYLGNENNPYLYLLKSKTQSITTVTIDKNCRFIATYALQYCTSLTSVNFGGTTAQWHAIQKGENWAYKVPATKVVCTDGNVSI